MGRTVGLFVAAIVVLAAFVLGAVNDEKDAAFLKWLVENKVQMPKIRFAEFVDTGAGVMAMEDVNVGDLIVHVPSALFLTSDRLNKTKMAPILEVVTGLNTHYQLALVLLHEMSDPQSFWRPYLDTLPKKLDTTMFFTVDEMKELEGSNIVPLTAARIQQLKSNYDAVFPYLFEKFSEVFPKDVFSPDQFSWALGIVWRNSFYMKNAENLTISVLVPLLDRFNHGPVETNFRLEEATGDVHVSTQTAVKKGSEIAVSRGPKSNLELLLDFGYTLENNPGDNVALSVRMTGEDTLSKLKIDLLEAAGLQPNGTYILRESVIPDVLLKALRLQLLRESELGLFQAVLDGKAASLHNELRVHRAILAACTSMLDAYHGTVEDDEVLLKTQLGHHMRSAVILRLREKKIIASVIGAVSRRWRDILVDGFPEPEAAPKPVEK